MVLFFIHICKYIVSSWEMDCFISEKMSNNDNSNYLFEDKNILSY